MTQIADPSSASGTISITIQLDDATLAEKLQAATPQAWRSIGDILDDEAELKAGIAASQDEQAPEQPMSASEFLTKYRG